MEVIMIQGLIIGIMTIGVLLTIYQIKVYWETKRKYGNKRSNVIFRKSLHILFPLIPRKKSKRYKNTEKAIKYAGWDIAVEYFYVIKLSLFLIALTLLFFINNTNKHIRIQEIMKSTYSNEVTAQEVENKVFEFFYNNNDYQNASYEDMLSAIQNDVNTLGQIDEVNIENTLIMAKQIKNKIDKLENAVNNHKEYINILFVSSMVFFVPDILALIRFKLIQNTKNWEALYAMVVFSVFGKLPPNSVDKILEHIQEVTKVNKPQVLQFKELLKKNNKEEIRGFIKEVDNEDMQEVFEMLSIGKGIGLQGIVDDVEEMYKGSLEWLDIENNKKRQEKLFICMIPAAIIFLLLIMYFQYGSTAIVNSSYMNL